MLTNNNASGLGYRKEFLKGIFAIKVLFSVSNVWNDSKTSYYEENFTKYLILSPVKHGFDTENAEALTIIFLETCQKIFKKKPLK